MSELSKKHQPNESNPNSHREYFRLKSAAEQFTEHVWGKHAKQPWIKRGLSCKKSDKSQATTLKQVFVGKYVCVCECLSSVKPQMKSSDAN